MDQRDNHQDSPRPENKRWVLDKALTEEGFGGVEGHEGDRG